MDPDYRLDVDSIVEEVYQDLFIEKNRFMAFERIYNAISSESFTLSELEKTDNLVYDFYCRYKEDTKSRLKEMKAHLKRANFYWDMYDYNVSIFGEFSEQALLFASGAEYHTMIYERMLETLLPIVTPEKDISNLFP